MEDRRVRLGVIRELLGRVRGFYDGKGRTGGLKDVAVPPVDGAIGTEDVRVAMRRTPEQQSLSLFRGTWLVRKRLAERRK